jgi:hypothetical protein
VAADALQHSRWRAVVPTLGKVRQRPSSASAAAAAAMALALSLLPRVVIGCFLARRLTRCPRRSAVPCVAQVVGEDQVSAMFAQLDHRDNGLLQRPELARLCRQLSSYGGPLAKRFTEEDLDDALLAMDAAGKGGVSLPSFLYWWSHTGSQAKGTLGAAIDQVLEGRAVDSKGSATVSVWQAQLEQVSTTPSTNLIHRPVSWRTRRAPPHCWQTKALRSDVPRVAGTNPAISSRRCCWRTRSA